MLTLVSPELEQYAVDHTTPLPNLLQELIRVTYEEMDSPQMLSGPIEGRLLQFLVFATRAERVLEIGTFTGFSSQMMAENLPESGTVVTCEIDPKAAEMARFYFNKSPHGHKIDLRIGPALETLRSLSGSYDLVFIDADKTNYIAYYERSLELLSPNGIIVVDNVLWSGRVLDPKDEADHAIVQFNRFVREDVRVQHVLLTVRDGIMVIRRAQ